MAPDSLINRVGWCKVSGVSLLLDVRYCSCNNLNVLEIYKRGGGRYGAQLSKSKFSSLKNVIWSFDWFISWRGTGDGARWQLTWSRQQGEVRHGQHCRRVMEADTWPVARLKLSSRLCHWKKYRELTWICRASVFESGAFSPCFSEPSSTPSSSHNISWHCLPDSGWRSLSKALRWGMEIVHIVQVPWLITDSDSNHSNNKKLDLFLQLGSATALGRKHFWNYIFIKIWENIWGGAQGDTLNGTLRPIFS